MDTWKKTNHPTPNNYCSCFTDDSETKKPKLQWTVGSMNEISVWEQYNIFRQVTLYLMISLPIFFLHLLLWILLFQNLIIKKIFFCAFDLTKPLPLVYVYINHPSGNVGFPHSQNSLVKDVFRYGLQGLFKSSPRIHSSALSIAQIYYLYRLWQQSKCLPLRIYFNAGGNCCFPWRLIKSF